MVIDFSKLPKAKAKQASAEPKEIFKQRPAGDLAANDLWQGQAQALEEWYASDALNTLINLNTGAGKTYVGLLIAQSLVNQGKCSLCMLND
jgi:replicative superfamily II helicase